MYGFSCKQDIEDSTVFQLQHFEAYDDEHSVEMTNCDCQTAIVYWHNAEKDKKEKEKKEQRVNLITLRHTRDKDRKMKDSYLQCITQRDTNTTQAINNFLPEVILHRQLFGPLYFCSLPFAKC